MEENEINEEEKDRKLSAGKGKPTNQDKVPDTDEFLSQDELEMINGEDTEFTQSAKGESPLDSPVVERSYTERKYVGDTMSPIAEPKENYQQQIPQQPQPTASTTSRKQEKLNAEERREEDKRFATEGLGEANKNSGGGNPAAATMSDAETKKYAASTVDTTLHLYAKLWSWLSQFLQITDNQLVARVREGKCPPDWAVLYDRATNEALTLREFIHEGNKKIIAACQTDPTWVAQVRPLMIDEFIKRNWIVTPKNNLLVLVGSDVLDRSQKIFANVMAMKKIMSGLDKEFAEKKKSGLISLRDDYNARLYGYTPPPPPPPNYTAPQPPPQQETPPPPPPKQEAEQAQEQAENKAELAIVKEEAVFEVPVD